ncbi:hypothetical protein B0H14DRAFT_3561552 [Mycena olivaceomarginata]|nr:hypothetical protein B0H14DRAFT_3561552 [Mycena olivaceomarginata]
MLCLSPLYKADFSPIIYFNKALHLDSSSDTDSGEDLLSTNKRLRSASVEPLPQPLIVPPTAKVTPATANPDPKAILKSLHFTKATMANNSTDSNRYQAIQGVTQLTNSQQYTMPPDEGFPAIHLLESPLHNTTDHNRNAWATVSGPKGWVHTYCPKYDPNPREVVQKLKYVIPLLVDVSNMIISPPTARENPTECSPAPWHFLISSLPEVLLKKLTDQVLWSMPTIIFIILYDTPLPRYIMSLQNFTIFDHEEGIHFICATIMAKLKAIRNTVDALVVNAAIDTTAAEACLDTIVVKPLDIALPGGKTDTVWNVYFPPLWRGRLADVWKSIRTATRITDPFPEPTSRANPSSSPPPTLSLSNYLKWMQAACSIKYKTDNFGTGVARTGEDQFTCGGCRSYDHPVGLCWAQHLIGWFGEQPKSLTSEDATLLDANGKVEKNAGASGSKQGPKKGKFADGRIAKRGGKAQHRR